MLLGSAQSLSVLLTLLACYVVPTQAQPAPITPANPLDPLGVFVVLKCLPTTFLSFALHGVPIDPVTSGGTNIGPANGAGPASFSPTIRTAMQTILDVDSTQLRELRALGGSRQQCPVVNVGPQVWETFFSVAFDSRSFDPYQDESKFLLCMYFLKIIHQAVMEVDLKYITDPAILPLTTSVAAVVVEQANTCLALSRANANSTVLGTLTLADAGNKFIDFLAAVGFKITPGSLDPNPTNTAGQLPAFASVQDYYNLLSIAGSRRGGKFYPDGIVLTPELSVPPVGSTSTKPSATQGRRLLSQDWL